MADLESGHKWWIRYVLVPIIVVVGGIAVVWLRGDSKKEEKKEEPIPIPITVPQQPKNAQQSKQSKPSQESSPPNENLPSQGVQQTAKKDSSVSSEQSSEPPYSSSSKGWPAYAPTTPIEKVE